MTENFGSYLKHERELRGVPLEEIAEVTKIHIRFLEALENSEFDQLPGEVFIKGYIRSYAKVIGLNSEEMVNAYDDSVGKDRREEIEKVDHENEKIRSRKKSMAAYVLGALGLAGILAMGYLVAGSLDEGGNADRDEQLSEAGSTLNAVEPESSGEQDADNEERSVRGLENSVSEDDTISFPVDGRTRPETPVEAVHAVGKPPLQKIEKVEKVESETTNSRLKLTPPPSAEEKREKSGAPAQSAPNRPEAKTEESQPTPADSVVKIASSASEEGEKEKAKASEKPAETEKPSVSPEKPVIIQHVAGGSEEGDPRPKLPGANPKPLSLMIQVQGNSWFNVTVDDGGEEDFILPGGSKKTIYGNEKFRITIGNRRGTSLFLNGRSIDLPYGTSDVIRDFDITANLIE